MSRKDQTPVPDFAVELAEIEKTREVLKGYFPMTRLLPAPSLSRASGAEVHLKLENENPTGSFKVRGALSTLLKRLDRSAVKEVVTCSTGNHGAATAYAARLAGIAATIFLPENPNPVKRARIAGLGASIVEGGRDLSDALQLAQQHASSTGAYLLLDDRDPDMPAGTGTIACEILEQLPGADVIFVPVGDTALIRGVASAARQLKPDIEIVGVQAERAPAYTLSWQKGAVCPTATCDTIADGLATRAPIEENVKQLRNLIDDMTLVGEEEMLLAVRRLLLEEHVVAEPAGAAATAAWLKRGEVHGWSNVVLIVSGGNLTPEYLRRAALLEQ